MDRDLAELYEVETKALKQAVKRNMDIFPENFMFELTKLEYDNLRSQIVTSSLPEGKAGWGGTRYMPDFSLSFIHYIRTKILIIPNAFINS